MFRQVVLLVTLSVALAEEQQAVAEKKTGKRGIFDTAYYGNGGYGNNGLGKLWDIIFVIRGNVMFFFTFFD